MNRSEFLIKDLPDPEAARRFLDDLEKKEPQQFARLWKSEGFLSDVLSLVSYSPLLAISLLQNPGYIDWLKRRRADGAGRSKEELLESLARFALTHSQIEPQVLLARFRRRELLRIFLRDIRRLASIAEITEEISNLADAILEYALRAARQELENRFGMPLESDEKGRSRPAGFCVISLGKLGSRELNYSSDIDLLFMYSADGTTASTGTKDAISNREFSIKLAERIVKIVGEQTGEGAAYRVDLRLRPYGRIGSLAMSVADTVRYYLTEARAWERQVMIRSRPSAGDTDLFKDLFSRVEGHVFSVDVSVADALENVRRSKEKIDFELRASDGFNVKLGRGGIREIEFIAQALQLAYGGADRWLRAPHTLISLARLSDRGLIKSGELTQLFDAYEFLRRLEHILQMEHGLQTHVLHDESDHRKLVAAKMGSLSEKDLERVLKRHTENVSRVFRRVFDQAADNTTDPIASPIKSPIRMTEPKLVADRHAPKDQWMRFLRYASPRFAARAAADTAMISEFNENPAEMPVIDYRDVMNEAIASAADLKGKLAAMRQAWNGAIVRIAVHDLLTHLSMERAKEEQTRLAEASINAAFVVAADEMAARLNIPAKPLPMAALALGKLGGGSIDYDSDLDLVLVYDDRFDLRDVEITPAEFFSRAAEIFVNALSSMTRNGSLYRVDLRLRPHGKNGPSAIPAQALKDYIASEAAIWELLAYVKFRGAGGDAVVAGETEASIREIIRSRVSDIDPEQLREETQRVRIRLEKERAGRLKANEVDIKYGPGGLLDIYFASRFLQLRDNVPDLPGKRSTLAILDRLEEAGSLGDNDAEVFRLGYNYLATLDHSIRLTIGRNTRVPFAHPEAMILIAKRMGSTVAALSEDLALRRMEIRQSFEKIIGP